MGVTGLHRTKIKGFLTDYSVAMVRCNVNKIITTRSLVTGHLLDTIIVASTEKGL